MEKLCQEGHEGFMGIKEEMAHATVVQIKDDHITLGVPTRASTDA